MTYHYLPGEREMIDTVVALAERYGYGRLIQVLQMAWSRKAQAEGFSRHSADSAAGIICVWCGTDRRTGKKAQDKLP